MPVSDRLLSTLEPFKHLPAPELKRLAAAASENGFAKGQTLFRAGTKADAVWAVKTGRVHLMTFLADGKVSTTCVMGPLESFCCLPALDRGTYPTDAVAAVDSVVVRVPIDDFHTAMSRSPAFLKETLCLFCDRLRQVEHKSCMIYEPAEQRLAKTLMGLMKKFGETIPLTRQELSEIAGTTHETAIRTLSRLAKDGLLRSSRGKLTILNTERLRAIADGA